jgi:MFS family permease
MFLVLTIFPFERKGLILGIFLVVNLVFALNSGCYSVVSSIIFGKVVPFNIRGKLMTVTGVAGGCAAMACIFLAVRPILRHTGGSPLDPYATLFLICSLLFLAAWGAILLIKEPPLAGQKTRRDLLLFARHSLRLVMHDRNFVRFFLVGAIVSVTYGLLQFYTVYVKAQLGIADRMLVWYLVCQVGCTPIGSVIYGLLADKYGNRLVIRIGSVIYACTPLTAVVVGLLPGLPHREWFYCAVYVLIGVNLPINQVLTNYLLEISPLELHPNYLGVYNALRSITMIFPPLVGLLIDTFYFNSVFLGMALFLVAGVVLAFKLVEPRHLEDKDEYKKEIVLG